jgi:integrase
VKDFREGLLPVPNCTAGLGDTMRDSQLQALPYGKETSAVRGLSAKKNADGSCSFLLSKKMKGKPSPLRLKLGKYPDMSIDAAETKAMRYRDLIDRGIDPRDHEIESAKDTEIWATEQNRKSITLREVFIEFMRHKQLREKHTDSTRKSYHQVMPQVWEPFFDKPIRSITEDKLEDHYEYWVSQRINPKTGEPAKEQIKKGIRYLKAVFRYAIKMKKYLNENPCDIFMDFTLTAKKNENHLLLTETEEICEWLSRLRLPDENMVQHLPKVGLTKYAVSSRAQVVMDLITLELLSGLRMEEVCQLRWDKVFFEETDWKRADARGPYFQVFIKQQRGFGVPVTSQMAGVFQRRWAARTNDYVFPSYRKPQQALDSDRGGWDILKKLMTPAKSNTLSANVLRHTFATAVYMSWQDIGLAHRMTGHYSEHTGGVATDTYIHMQAETHRDKFQEINDVLTGALPENERLRIQREFERHIDDGIDFPMITKLPVELKR